MLKLLGKVFLSKDKDAENNMETNSRVAVAFTKEKGNPPSYPSRELQTL